MADYPTADQRTAAYLAAASRADWDRAARIADLPTTAADDAAADWPGLRKAATFALWLRAAGLVDAAEDAGAVQNQPAGRRAESAGR